MEDVRPDQREGCGRFRPGHYSAVWQARWRPSARGRLCHGRCRSYGWRRAEKMYSLNFETAYFAARPLFQHMLKNEYGRIVFMGARPALKAEQGGKRPLRIRWPTMLFTLAGNIECDGKGKECGGFRRCAQHHRHSRQTDRACRMPTPITG